MKKVIVLSVVVIAGIIAVTIGVKTFLEVNKPIAEKKETAVMTPAVEVFVVQTKDVDFSLKSEGVVSTLRETVLSTEVSGKVIFVDPRFEVGGSFKADEIIVRIDDTNYRAAVAQAESALADARLSLKQEGARSEQAARDWKRIGEGREPGEMVLRVPFLKSAEARVASAQAMLDKALEDLVRTELRAPFDCRVREARLDLGAVSVPGTQVGTVYDHSKYIVRLPFSLRDYATLPEDGEITLSAEIGGLKHEWKAKVMWEDGDLDRRTLSAYQIVEVLPQSDEGGKFRLPPAGLFVRADVSGARLEKVIAVPRLAVRGRNQIAVMNEKDELEFRQLKIVRSTSDTVFAKGGVKDGERVILTKLELPVQGMKLIEVERKEES